MNGKPKTIMVILIALIVLALVGALSLATTRLAFGGPNGRPLPANGGQGFQGNGTGQDGFQGNGNGQGNGTRTYGGRNSGIFNLFSVTRSLGLNPMVFIYVNLGFSVIGILLLLWCAYGIWKDRKWGLNYGMLLALIYLVGALPGLFSIGGRYINWVRIISNVVSVIAALSILGLGILPSVRDHFPRLKKK